MEKKVKSHLESFQNAINRFDKACSQEEAGDWKSLSSKQRENIQNELYKITKTVADEERWLKRHLTKAEWEGYLCRLKREV